MTCDAELCWFAGRSFRGFTVRCDLTLDHVVHSAPLDAAEARVRLPGPRLRRRSCRGPRVDVSGVYDPAELRVRVTWRDPSDVPADRMVPLPPVCEAV